MEQKRYEDAWKLLDEHPEVISSSAEKLAEIGPDVENKVEKDDFYDDAASSQRGDTARLVDSAVEKEKRRVGELWIQQQISAGDWKAAGATCAKVLGTSSRWEHWVWTFAGAKRFDDIVDYIPTKPLQPPLPTTVYGTVLGYYIIKDRLKLKDLLERWPTELLDVNAVTVALENQLRFRDVREDSVEDGQRGRDWRIVQESLGKLYVADGRPREALKCYMKLQDADESMRLIKEYHLIDAVADDIPGLIMLKVPKAQMKTAPQEELEESTSEVISLLVNEAHHGLVRPETVVSQLQEKKMSLYLFFYLRALWTGESLEDGTDEVKDRMVADSRTYVDDFADLAAETFARYDRPLLMDFLKTSTFYTFEKVSQVCEELDFIPELVYLYSKTGQTKRALFLIIDRLQDVSQAIAFAKQQDDADLWDDLLEYSMDKPRFIRALLEEVGTSINPIRLVRRIPEGLEIEGLKEGLGRMIREHEIQWSISDGVARVLRGEVAAAMNMLRSGQRKGVKFDVVLKSAHHLDIATDDVATKVNGEDSKALGRDAHVLAHDPIKPGHCVGCHEPFQEEEMETLVGYACGHIFHLSHLMEYLKQERPPTPPRYGEEEEYGLHPRVGAKVTHARLLKDRLQEGCPVCHGGARAE
jgi:hypothetical protein